MVEMAPHNLYLLVCLRLGPEQKGNISTRRSQQGFGGGGGGDDASVAAAAAAGVDSKLVRGGGGGAPGRSRLGFVFLKPNS